MSRRRHMIGDLLHKLGIINRFYITRDRKYMYTMYTVDDPANPPRSHKIAQLYFRYIYKHGL